MSTDSADDVSAHPPSPGDEHLAHVYSKFAGRLIALARSQLDAQLLTRVDADDVVQSALRSFCRRSRESPFEFADGNGMWALLAQITVRKCHGVKRRHFAQRRDIRREKVHATGLSDPLADCGQSREPNPSEVVAFRELLIRIVESIPADKRNWLIMRLQGYSVSEISHQVQRTERAVYRLLERARQLAVELDCEESFGTD